MRNNRSEHVANVALTQQAIRTGQRIHTHRVASPFNLYNAARIACAIVVLSLLYSAMHF